ncbi:MAG: hypothetical protein GF350_05010, partial [Chitinivibrionales bacterium]|nr:hypothetical protein [Chitinivibrionales bacterium]
MDLTDKVLKFLIGLGIIGILAYSAVTYLNWKDYKAQQVIVPVEGKILFTSIGRDNTDTTFLLVNGKVRGLSEAGSGKFLAEDKYITFWRGGFRIWDLSGEPIKTIDLSKNYKPFEFDVSPDGKTIVFTSDMGERFAPYNLYSIDIDGSDLKQLTDFKNKGKWLVGNPAISPDAKKVVFCAGKDPENPESPTSLYLMNIDGGGKHELFGEKFIGGWEAAWSPDMSELVFISSPNKYNNIYKINLSTMKIAQLTSFNEKNYGHAYNPCYSPDGKQICFALKLRGVTAGQELFAINSDGTNLIRLTPAKKINAYPGWVTDKYPDWIE